MNPRQAHHTREVGHRKLLSQPWGKHVADIVGVLLVKDLCASSCQETISKLEQNNGTNDSLYCRKTSQRCC